MKRIVAAVGLLLGISMCATGTLAGPVSYNYESGTFSVFYDPINGQVYNCQVACRIFGFFTLATPLGDNFSGTVNPLSFSFEAPFGPPLTSSDEAEASFFEEDFDFTTNSYGAITAWSISAAEVIGYSEAPTGLSFSTQATCGPDGCGDNGSFFWVCEGDPCGAAYPAGFAILNAVPEPSSLLLTATGLLCLCYIGRRKIRRSAHSAC